MNVFVIVADSWRADFLGAYGNGWIRTPNLDQFAQESTVFREAYSENMPTLPARQTMFTGRFGLPFRRWQPFDVDAPVLAEQLWKEGWKTAMVSDTFPMFDPAWGGRFYGRGFETVLWERGQGMEDVMAKGKPSVDPGPVIKGDGSEDSRQIRREIANYLSYRGEREDKRDHFCSRVVQNAKNDVDNTDLTSNDDNLFLWLDLFDPHEP